ncbi:MAG: hypothetical protein QGI75_08550 [Phycisphaerales bacterium]|jgi:hypothetical protein|nr:hypothetical protein [Phycisphaerales bacterium]MDP6890440.1 hypothetical protein [Phycisphaerales bacterium]
MWLEERLIVIAIDGWPTLTIGQTSRRVDLSRQPAAVTDVQQ